MNADFLAISGIFFALSLIIGTLCAACTKRSWVASLAAFLLLAGVETCAAGFYIPRYRYFPALIMSLVYACFLIQDLRSGELASTDKKEAIRLPVKKGVPFKYLEFYYFFANFLVYGGAGSGKTASIGKWLLQEYIRLGFAGFVYDFKDRDYTRTAYNLIKKYDYPHKFYRANFDRPEQSHRFNPLKVVKDRTELMQLMEDMLLALSPKDEKQNEWFAGALGILRGVTYRLWDEYREYCTIPHILCLLMTVSKEDLEQFLQQNELSEMMAGAYMKASGSEKTQASYLSTLCNSLSTIAQDENIAYVLSGDDFEFNLIDPQAPKMFAVSNNFSKNSVYSPVIAMLVSISSRQFTMENKVPFVYFMDEMTTVNVRKFEGYLSVLREYMATFVIISQSGAKVESQHGKLDRNSIESNSGNIFLGRTKDVEALKYYPTFFGKEEKERSSKSKGKSGNNTSSSVTLSSQKEDVYQGRDFSVLEPGEFIGSATQSNVKDFKVKFKQFKMKEEEMPDIRVLEEGEVSRNYARILAEVRSIVSGEI